MQSPLSASFTRILEALNAKVQPLENEIDDYMGPTLRLPSAPIGAIGNAGMQRSQSNRTNVSSQYARSPNRLSKQSATSIDDMDLHIHDNLIEELSSLRKKKYSTNAIVDDASVMATAAASDYVDSDVSYNQAPMYAISDTTKDQPAVHDAHHHDQRPTSSMTRQLSQSLQAWSEVARLLDSLGQRTIYLGAEEVRSRVVTRPRDVDAASSSEHESPSKKRRTATLSDENHDDNDDDTDVSPELMNDALQIKKMAVLYAQMREIHAKFARELQDFATKTKKKEPKKIN